MSGYVAPADDIMFVLERLADLPGLAKLDSFQQADVATTRGLLEEAGRFYEDMVQIVGGMDLLPRAFMAALGARIRFGTRVVALEQDADGVTAHYRTAARRQAEKGDVAIVTLPFSVLRHIDANPHFSRAKQRAIRQLHYDASAKILAQCRRRFWEIDDGIFGGGLRSLASTTAGAAQRARPRRRSRRRVY